MLLIEGAPEAARDVGLVPWRPAACPCILTAGWALTITVRGLCDVIMHVDVLPRVLARAYYSLIAHCSVPKISVVLVNVKMHKIATTPILEPMTPVNQIVAAHSFRLIACVGHGTALPWRRLPVTQPLRVVLGGAVELACCASVA